MNDQSPEFERRRLLELATFGVASVLTPGAASATSGAETPIPDNATSVDEPIVTSNPILLPDTILGVAQYVPAGMPIYHRLAWKTVGEEDRKVLEDLKTVTDYSFIIDGERIDESAGTWTIEKIDPEQQQLKNSDTSSEYWRLEWRYRTFPRQPGIYEFTTKVRFTESFTSKISERKTKERSGTYQYHGSYEVVPRNTYRSILATNDQEL